MFQIDISSLDPGVHRVRRAPAVEALDFDAEMLGDIRGFDDIRVEVMIDYQPQRVLVRLQARASAALTCDRTLRPFEQPVEGAYSALFAPQQRQREDAFEEPDENDAYDEVRDLPPGARTLDLTDLVRDTLLLAVPQRQVAPGAEDENLDTVFGAPGSEAGDGDAPVDPRWEKLRQLKSDRDDA